jgi:hypothetical protein
MNEISCFEEGNRIAKVYPRTQSGYRVWMYDMITEEQAETFFNHEQAAEDAAEDWVLMK